jgi:hypothetical protein
MDNEFRSSVESNRPSRDEKSVKTSVAENSTADNIIDLLSGGKSISDLADSLNLNADLTQKVLVPLANMAQKYNVGQSVAHSKTGQTAGDLITVFGDIAPVIQGLIEYLAGQRKKLEDDDLAYLDAIKSAQSRSDFSDLFTDDILTFGEEVETEKPPSKPVDPRSSRQREVEETLGARLPTGWDPTQPIDWAEVLGEKPKTMGNNSVLGFGSLADIQAEADRLSGKITIATDKYDLSKGLSLDASLVPSTGIFMTMEDLIAEAGLTHKAAAEVLSAGSGGFKSESATAIPTVQAKSAVPRVAPVALDEISLDMGDFMSKPIEKSETVEDVMYLSDEEVEELRAEGFVFEEIDEETED